MEIRSYREEGNFDNPLVHCTHYKGRLEKTDSGLYVVKGTWKDLHSKCIEGTFEIKETKE